ncbi:MAG: putative bifunctional diguanylate cyclase/phosphodiesterase [Micromonosporaceae bacterium]
MAALTVAMAVQLAVQYPPRLGQVPAALLFFGLFLLAQAIQLHFEVRRHAFTLILTEIPLLLALFALTPILVIATRLASLLVVLLIERHAVVKIAYNLASVGVTTSVASLIVAASPPRDVGPGTWLVLAAAVAVATVISLASVVTVISLVQGLPPLSSLARTTASTFTVAAVNTTVGVVVLIASKAEPLSVLLLLFLGAILVFVYRAYAQFVRQHHSLAELYELTRIMADAGRDGSLPDVLLGRVRELLHAEYATLWLPAQGRYPELLLSARVDDPGLLDMSPLPAALRRRAIAAGETLVVGQKTGDEELRTELRDAGTKDAIVVPLRSGTAVIGSLEVVGRLGDRTQFESADVRLIETLANHVAVAVENSRLVDRLRFDAYHDALTSLPNRRRLLASLEQAVKVLAEGEVVTVMVFDIDGLRDVNDSLGHEAGDKLIREVGQRLRDQAPAAALVARVGGDEFAVILRLPSIDNASDLAAQLRSGLQQPMELGTITLDVDVAVGIAVHPDHGTDAEVILQRADLATHAAKQLSSPILLFHPSMESRTAHRLGLAADMRRALEVGEVEVHLQPKVALPDRRIVGVECLARWEHTAHGPVSPTDFVAVAEHTGQLARLTEIVMRQGLGRCRDWLEAGRPLPIAVNLSPRTLLDPTFPPRVAALLEEYGVPAHLLTLEITEDGVVGEPDRPLPTLRRLHEMGVRLAVDDFGTGYSSLSYLRRLPVDEVKIDQSFVQGMATDPGDLAIVRAVVDLARHFGLVVVAEGVESELTVSLLEEVGCDIGQGYLFSRPLPFERFEAWRAAQNEPPADGASPASGTDPVAEVRRLRAVP